MLPLSDPAHPSLTAWQRRTRRSRESCLADRHSWPAAQNQIGKESNPELSLTASDRPRMHVLDLTGSRSLNAETMPAIEQVAIALSAGIQRFHIVFI
jgi:hypothetical protein